jgi:hypothetical protein
MILRWRLADTLEFLHTDANFGRATIIPEFGIDMAIVRRAYHPECFNLRHGIASTWDLWL